MCLIQLKGEYGGNTSRCVGVICSSALVLLLSCELLPVLVVVGSFSYFKCDDQLVVILSRAIYTSVSCLFV